MVSPFGTSVDACASRACSNLLWTGRLLNARACGGPSVQFSDLYAARLCLAIPPGRRSPRTGGAAPPISNGTDTTCVPIGTLVWVRRVRSRLRPSALCPLPPRASATAAALRPPCCRRCTPDGAGLPRHVHVATSAGGRVAAAAQAPEGAAYALASSACAKRCSRRHRHPHACMHALHRAGPEISRGASTAVLGRWAWCGAHRGGERGAHVRGTARAVPAPSRTSRRQHIAPAPAPAAPFIHPAIVQSPRSASPPRATRSLPQVSETRHRRATPRPPRTARATSLPPRNVQATAPTGGGAG